MLRFIFQVLFMLAVFFLLMFVAGALMPILTHPLASVAFCVLFVLFAVNVYKRSQE